MRSDIGYLPRVAIPLCCGSVLYRAAFFRILDVRQETANCADREVGAGCLEERLQIISLATTGAVVRKPD
jgi:hypothetical protein